MKLLNIIGIAFICLLMQTNLSAQAQKMQSSPSVMKIHNEDLKLEDFFPAIEKINCNNGTGVELRVYNLENDFPFFFDEDIFIVDWAKVLQVLALIPNFQVVIVVEKLLLSLQI